MKFSFLKGNQIGYLESTVKFTACPPGKFYNSPLRSMREEPIVGCPDDCPLGTFAPEYAYRESSCPVCQTGHYCSDTKSHPTKCEAGRFSDKDRQTESSSCVECPVGKYMDRPGQVLCLPCVPGLYQDKPSSVECKNCSVGRYTDTTLALACKRCDPGSSNFEPGSTFCERCLPGYYGNDCRYAHGLRP